MKREEFTYQTNTGEFVAEKLLPCPFCGGEPEFVTIGNDYTKSRKAEIKCIKCFCKRTTGAIHNNLEWCGRKAIELWNKRTAEQPLPPAEGATDKFRDVLNEVQRYIETNGGATESEMKAIWNSLSCAITESEKRQPTADGAEASRQIRQLKEFHTAFKLPQRDIPTIIPPDEFKLRHKILIEEVGELSDAYLVGDIVEVADAITDCLYVLIGTALQFGLADKLEACFDEVHRSNMSKLGSDGKPVMREDGKVMKGENYTRPDLKRILNEPTAAHQQPTAEGAENEETMLEEGELESLMLKISHGEAVDSDKERAAELWEKRRQSIFRGEKKLQWSGYGELGNISQKPLQPTAEGAEEIIESIVESLGEPINIHNHIFEIRPYTVEHKTEWWIFHKEVGSGEPLAQWLSKFATLHAQKIADKMVSERLREELIKYDNWASMQGWDWLQDGDSRKYVDEYLKSRDSHG